MSVSPALKIGTNFAVLSIVGINSVLKDKLKEWQIGPIIIGMIDFIKFVDILSGPELFFTF